MRFLFILNRICAIQKQNFTTVSGLYHYFTTLTYKQYLYVFYLLALPINLFFSSLAIRTASANPMPEEQPVISTIF